MNKRRFVFLALAMTAGVAVAADVPPAAVDIPAGGSHQPAVAVLAGGCFWGVEAVFDHLKGVTGVVSGYAGGSSQAAHYEMVGTGRTGHAESVQITYDPSQISYGKLLQVFFTVAHDPTQINRQGPDEGTQYRSAIFYQSEEQKRVAEAYIQQLTEAKVFRHPIATKVVPLPAFYPAEAYHQNYIARNPGNPYVVYNDLPKLSELKKRFPELTKGR
ncbi:MAG TPA: peptide-methionine (S)-S-oxide reductase MsrA [Candidatus Acidoferrales bacterium]|jgi:peptide-methionine (S)-S-oxide reductase|nr:peptide-methionine (S)-S-oxide reductase MsrA [Candidatus Acidoferrales bacterium]